MIKNEQLTMKERMITMYMLWFNFLLGSNFIFLCFGVW